MKSHKHENIPSSAIIPYWYSFTAVNVVHPNANKNMLDAVQMQIDLPTSVNERPLSCIDLIEGSEAAGEDISKNRKWWL